MKLGCNLTNCVANIFEQPSWITCGCCQNNYTVKCPKGSAFLLSMLTKNSMLRNYPITFHVCHVSFLQKGDVKEETTESKPTGLKSPDFAMRVPKSGAYMEKDISVYDFDDDDDMKPLKLSHNSTGSSPQFSSPKGSLLSPRGTLSGSKGSLLMSPYSTSSIKEEDSASDIGGDLSTSFEAERKVSPLKLSNFDASRKVSPLKLGALVHSTPGLKLKVSGGKIVG